MTVHFIGAGPGAPDLITIRGRNLIAKCEVCLYAGSLVPQEVVAFAPQGALVHALVQASVFTWFASSHCSSPLVTPSPQRAA